MADSIRIIAKAIPITITQGNTLIWTTTIKTNGVAEDLTVSNTVVSVVIESTTTGTNILEISSTGVSPAIAVNAIGEATVTITAAQTAAIALGGYYYAFKWVNGTTGTVRTLHAGSFTVTKPGS